MTEPNAPALSVVMTVVDGGETLVRCLEALDAQVDAPPFEVLIPYDVSIADEMAPIAARFPHMRFLNLGALRDGPPRDEFDRHELYDRRRAGGLHQTRAPLVAMIEDRGRPKPDWAKEIVAAHRAYPEAVIGGAVESAAKTSALWAIFFVDFGRYQAPFDSERPDYVTDTNICYKREALWSVLPLWSEMYQESVVNWALRDKGLGLRLTPAPVTVQYREPIAFWKMSLERVHWARIYGEVRARHEGLAQRLMLCAITPALPALLYWRHLRRQFRLKRHRRELFAATPMILWLLICWSVGEMLGYLMPPRVETPKDGALAPAN